MNPASAPRQITSLPGPKGWPVLGNLAQIKPAEFHLQLERWAQAHGRYYQLRLGPTRLLVTADHQAVAAMLRDRPDGFRRTERLHAVGTEMGLKPGLFGVNGDTWRRQRRMVMAAFDPGHVKAYFPSLVRCGQRLAGRWQQAAAAGTAIDLQADLMRFTVDAIAGLAFGTDVNTLQSDDDIIQRHLDKIFPKLFTRLVSGLPYWRVLKLPSDRALDHALAEVNRAIDGFIGAARRRLGADPQQPAAPQNLLEAMVLAADQPDSGIDDAQVSGNVMTMLLAGEDTTANTLAWCIWLLHQHPAALDRARAEVRSVMAGAATVTLDHLARLDYTEACMNETMRLKPVAPMLPLQALRDTVLGDVAVPAGTVVIGLMRHDGVDDQFVPEAKRFVPERWLGEGVLAGTGLPGATVVAAATSPKRISMPFGAGPRMCPGRYLALQEMKVALLTLLNGFDIDSVGTADGAQPAERMMFAMAPVGLLMRLRARQA